MSRGPEGKIQDAVLRYAKSKGLLYKKNEVGRYFVSSGWPDVIFFPAVNQFKFRSVFFMEFKAPGKGTTPIQDHRIKELTDRGYAVYVIDDAKAGKKIIDKECA